MSSTSFAKEDATVWDVIVVGVDGTYETMESLGTPPGVVTSKEDNEEDGLDEDGIAPAVVMLVGAMGATKEGMVMFEMGAGGGSTDAMVQMESALETL